MTAMTLTLPADMVEQAKAVGLDNEVSLLTALKNTIQNYKASQNQVKQRQIGGAEGVIIHMPDDFDEPLDDFRDYM